MNENKKAFDQLFYKYDFTPADREILNCLDDYSYRINKETREIRVDCFFSRLIAKERLYSLERGLTNAYQLQSCFLYPKYDPSLFDASYKDELLLELARNTRFAKGFFDDCVMTVSDGVVHIEMKAGYSKLPHNGECEGMLENIIRSEFGLNVKVEFHSAEFDMDEYLRKTNFTMLFDDVVKADPSPSTTNYANRDEFGQNSTVRPNLEDNTQFSFDPDCKLLKAGYCIFDLSHPEPAFGRKFKDEDLDLLRPIRDFDRELSDISFCAKVISSEEREMRGSDGYRVKLYVSDGASNITLKFSGTSEKVGGLRKAASGTPLFIVGNLAFDTFENELVVKPRSVSFIQEKHLSDDAEEKRIELHLHTKMSTMDATIEVKDIIHLAHQWGHRAVAITDHGNLQGFPDAMLTAEKLGMKVIYGMEGYFVDDTSRALYGDADGDFVNTEFVIFDIETTGLSPLS